MTSDRDPARSQSARGLPDDRDEPADAEAFATDDDPIMVEIEPGYLVGCATVDEVGGCVQSQPVDR